MKRAREEDADLAGVKALPRAGVEGCVHQSDIVLV